MHPSSTLSSMPAPEQPLLLQCPINLFERIEPDIRSFTALINQTRDLRDKGDLARTLIERTQTLLDCESFDDGNMNCRLCRQFSSLRQKTAELVLKIAGAVGAGEKRAP